MAAATGEQRDRRGVRGRLRVGRGVRPGLRARLRPPAQRDPGRRTHWLPAPNGIHFHPPTSLWVHTTEQPMNPVTELLVAHDLDDTRALLDAGQGRARGGLRRGTCPARPSWPGTARRSRWPPCSSTWCGPRRSGSPRSPARTCPTGGADDVRLPVARHDAVAPRWRRPGATSTVAAPGTTVLVDALCEPPESFVMSSVLAHVLTFAAHRRQLARLGLRAPGARGRRTATRSMWLRAAAGRWATR